MFSDEAKLQERCHDDASARRAPRAALQHACFLDVTSESAFARATEEKRVRPPPRTGRLRSIAADRVRTRSRNPHAVSIL
ncbi:MAG: hypothetical protein KF819_39955 [Labilithrix sp.]|nr:hypothetical protein [Labilithrix sp.]